MVGTIKFNSKEKAVLDALFKSSIPLSPYALREKTGLSYITLKKYVAKLVKDELLVEAYMNKGKVEFRFIQDKPKKKKSSTRGRTKKYTINPRVFN